MFGVRDTDEYPDDWREFYLERRRELRSLGAWFLGMVVAGALCVLGGRLFPESHVLVTVVFGTYFVAWLIMGGKWFVFVWTISSWDCPRCGGRFFNTGWGRNPLARRCMNCKLRRPKASEVFREDAVQRTTPR
jgi:hypothetical protein